MKKITSLIVALIFAISLGLAVVNSAKSTNSSNVQSYATVAAPPPPGPQKKKTGE